MKKQSNLSIVKEIKFANVGNVRKALDGLPPECDIAIRIDGEDFYITHLTTVTDLVSEQIQIVVLSSRSEDEDE